MSAKGTDKRGQGGATRDDRLDDARGRRRDAASTSLTDFHITGRLARFGRGGDDRGHLEAADARLRGRACRRRSRLAGRRSPGRRRVARRWCPRAVVAAEESDAADAAIASAGGAAAEAASASAAPPGAEKLAAGPARRLRAAGRPTTARGAPGRPRRGRRGARAASRAGAGGWLSDWPDGGTAGEAAAAASEVTVAARGAARAGVAFPAARRAAGAGRSGRVGGAAPVRTASIPPPGRPDQPASQTAKPSGGLSSFFSGSAAGSRGSSVATRRSGIQPYAITYGHARDT